MLRALNVATETQLLVFSKTGIQASATGPSNPRALYYDDSVVVGYIISGYLPDMFTWIGAGIIMCAGSYIAWHETRSKPIVSAQRA